MSSPRVVIVGGGHSGGAVAFALRRLGFDGSIVIVGEERYLPYQRPPLSKSWLIDKNLPESIDSLVLQNSDFYVKSRISIQLNSIAVGIDLSRRSIVLDDGKNIEFDKLILATGSRPRKLNVPIANSDIVHELRGIDDASRLQHALRKSNSVSIIGGGYIGLEVAASVRSLGKSVVLLEREALPLKRVASDIVAEFFLKAHREQGVRILTNTNVVAIEEDGVRLGSGHLVPADCTVVGIGATPNDELARAVGINCDDGICVDSNGRTSVDDIYAIGDVSRRPLQIYRRTARLESVANAIEQAKRAAADICGVPQLDQEVPWFWSDQFTYKLQIAGVNFGANAMVTRGDLSAGTFSVVHLESGVIKMVEAVNRPADFVAGKKLIATQQQVSLDRLNDTGIPLKELID